MIHVIVKEDMKTHTIKIGEILLTIRIVEIRMTTRAGKILIMNKKEIMRDNIMIEGTQKEEIMTEEGITREEKVTMVDDLMIGNLTIGVMMEEIIRGEIVMIIETLIIVMAIHLIKEGGVMMMVAVLGKICTEGHITVGEVLHHHWTGTAQLLTIIIPRMHHTSMAIHRTLRLSLWTFISTNISCICTSFTHSIMSSTVLSLDITTWVTLQNNWHSIMAACTTLQDMKVPSQQSKLWQ